MPYWIKYTLTALLLQLVSVNSVLAEQKSSVELMHWWVSKGEQASIAVLLQRLSQQNISWQAQAHAGSGTSRYGDILIQRVAKGQPPTASQMIGYDIKKWAVQGVLHRLDELAIEGEWDEVIPNDIQLLSKYQGHWIAAPINAHSTNWLWINNTLLKQIDGQQPDNWHDLIQLLDKAQTAGIIPLAIGREAWEHTLLFESVAAGVGGAEFYRHAFIDLNADALDPELLLVIFQRMSKLRTYLDQDFAKRYWDDATDLVRQGKALLQVQGTWVNGEFIALDLIPGVDFQCFNFPDTQGMFLFNSDQYVFFKDSKTDTDTRTRLVKTLMDADFQRDLNLRTGAAPARADVPLTHFNSCGQRSIAHMRSSNMRRSLMGSIAMGNANPAHTKEAIYRVVSDHFYGRITDTQAVSRLQAAVITNAEQSIVAVPARPQAIQYGHALDSDH